MHEPLELPSRAGDVGTIDRDLFFVALDLRFTNRAVRGDPHFLWRIIRIAPIGNWADDLGNDFTGALYLHPVARPQILLADQIEVVERRQLDRRSADLHRLQHREWVEGARAANIHLD